MSQKGIVVAAVLDVHDDVAPSTQPTSLEGSFDRGVLHLQLYPFSIGESQIMEFQVQHTSLHLS